MTGFMIDIGVDSLTKLVTDRMRWIEETAHVELAAREADHAWEIRLDAVKDDYGTLLLKHEALSRKYELLRAGLRTALETESPLTDEHMVELIAAEVKIARAEDNRLQSVRDSADQVRGQLTDLVRDVEAASNLVGLEPSDRTANMRPVDRELFTGPALGAPCDSGEWRVGDTVEVLNDDWHVIVKLIMRYQAENLSPENSDLWHGDVETVDRNYGTPHLRPALGTRILLHENDTSRNRLSERAKIADVQGVAQ